MTPRKKWTGSIAVTLTSGQRWSGAWEFIEKPGGSKPARILRATRRAMAEEKIKGRSMWRRYTIVVELPVRA